MIPSKASLGKYTAACDSCFRFLHSTSFPGGTGTVVLPPTPTGTTTPVVLIFVLLMLSIRMMIMSYRSFIISLVFILLEAKILPSLSHNDYIKDAKDHVGRIGPEMIEVYENPQSVSTKVIIVTDVIFSRSVQYLLKQ